MTRILVTGGTGTLGRFLVARLAADGQDVALLSRRPAPTPAAESSVAWYTGDLYTGDGLDAALDGVDTVVHCATGKGDRRAAGRLIRAAANGSRPHLVYVSIVGVDRIPFSYYRSKLAVEQMIAASGLAWTTLRATQFHDLIAFGARALAVSPAVVMPRGLRFQPIAPVEVAARLADLALAPAAGRVDDMGGPEIKTAEDLVRDFVRAHGKRRVIARIPVPGKVFAAFRAGRNLTPAHAVGRQTFREWLAEQP